MAEPDYKVHFEITSTAGFSSERDRWGNRPGTDRDAPSQRVGKKISFGPRSLGDIGRDIIAVKYALGQVVSVGQIEATSSTIRDDTLGQTRGGWFDCNTGQPISLKKTATFDREFQAVLMNYQVEKQFLIMLYYFFKYGVRKLLRKDGDVDYSGPRDPMGTQTNALFKVNSDRGSRTNRGYGTLSEELVQKELIAIKLLYDKEFGHLGEATLALLHGWTPRSEFTNEGYLHPEIEKQIWLQWPQDEEGEDLLVEIIPGELYQMYRRGVFGTKEEYYPEIATPTIRTPRSPDFFYRNSTHIEMYLSQCPGKYNWISDKTISETTRDRLRLDPSSDDGAVDEFLQSIVSNEQGADFNWGAVLFKQRIRQYESVLFQAVNHVVATLKEDSVNTELGDISPEERLRLLERAFEPDHLSTNDPFIINLNKIGFFDRTVFTMDAGNLPPDPEASSQLIKEIEDLALKKILDFYEKPDLWYYSRRSPYFEREYHHVNADPWEPGPDHSRHYPIHVPTGDRHRFWVLSTQATIDAGHFPSRAAQHYSVIEGFNSEEPLIKFIDFRSPSLRPGDQYRAYFEINRSKLDIIMEGDYVAAPSSGSELLSGETPSEMLDNTLAFLDACLDAPDLTDAEREALTAEYQSYIAKRQREASRELRAKTEEYRRKEEIQNSFNIQGGVFGNLNLSDKQYSQAVAREFVRAGRGLSELWSPSTDLGTDSASALRAKGVKDGEALSKLKKQHQKEYPNTLKITFPILKSATKQAVENMNQAASESDEDGIKYSPTDFNLRKEANYLKDIEPQLRNLVKLRIPNFVFNQDQLKPGDVHFRLIEESGGSNGIIITFSDVKEDGADGNFIGKRIDKIVTNPELGPGRGQSPSIIFDRFNTDAKLKKVPKNWDKRPRTMAYLVNIKKMAFGGDGLFDRLTQDRRGSCKDIGLGKRGASYATKYTPGVRVTSKSGYWKPVSQWWDKKVADPVEAWKDKSKQGAGAALRGRSYGGQVLPMLGDNCTKDQLYREFLDKVDLASLLCDYLKCIKLPGFNIKIPNFNLPPIPDLSGIFGFYPDLIDFIVEKWEEIITRLLCTFVRALLELLTIPWCEEQLEDMLYGAGASSAPAIKSTIANMLNLMEEDEIPAAQKFVDDSVKLLTPRELCRLLSGEPVNESVYEILNNLASLDPIIAERMNTAEGVNDFFSTIGKFLDASICQQLEEVDKIVGAASCEETVSLLNQVRNKITSSGDVSPEELQRALDLAEKNLMDQARALEILGEDGMSGLLPPAFELDNKDALISALPAPLEESIINTGRAIFETAKTNHVSSLDGWKQNLYLTIPKLPDARDKNFPEQPLLDLEYAAQTLREFAKFVSYRSMRSLNNLKRAIVILYTKYETEEIKVKSKAAGFDTPVYNTVHRHRIRDSRGRLIEISYLQSLNHDNPDKLELIPRRMNGVGQYAASNFALVDWATLGSIEKYHLGDSKETEWIFDPADTRTGNSNNMHKLWSINDKNKPALLKKMKHRLGELKEMVDNNLEVALRPQPTSDLLPLFRDIFSKFAEDRAEGAPRRQFARVNAGSPISERVDTSEAPRNGEHVRWTTPGEQTDNTSAHETLEIKVPENYRYTPSVKYKEFPGPAGKIEIEVDDTFFMGSRRSFEYCSAPPEKYVNHLMGPEFINKYPKRYVFAKHYQSKLIEYLDKYGKDLESIEGYRANSFIHGIYERLYKRSLEGILEQIFFEVENSRLFDEGYVNQIAPIIAGQAHHNLETGCVENKYSLSHFGILSFDNMVTNELVEEVKKELKKPENKPENMDYNSPGPIEKGIQSTALRGYIRICLIEFLLKGSLTYPIWDLSGVIEDNFFREYVIEFVTNQIYNNKLLSDDMGLLDRTIENIAPNVPGQPSLSSVSTSEVKANNPALRRIIEIELQRLPSLSKKIFLNNPEMDYSKYYLHNSITHTNISRDYDEDSGIWVLPEKLSLKNYNDPFMYMESYLHIRGDLANLSNLVIATPLEFFEENSEQLRTLEGYYSNISLSFPALEDYDFKETRTANTDFIGNTDQDPWLNDEVLHINDFQTILDQLAADPEIERYFSDLLQTINDRNSNAHGFPRVIIDTPGRFIKRKRKVINFRENPICKYGKQYKENFAHWDAGRTWNLKSYPLSTILRKFSPGITEDFFVGWNQDTHFLEQEDPAGTFSDYWPSGAEQVITAETKFFITPVDGKEILKIDDEEAQRIEDRIDHSRARSSVRDIDTSVPDAEKVMNKVFGLTGHHNSMMQLLDRDHNSRGVKMENPLSKSASWRSRVDTGNNIVRSTHPRPGVDSVLFSNVFGEIPNASIYSEIKETYNADNQEGFTEETWSETILDLRSGATPTYKSVGETCDEAISAFEPTQETKRLFNSLREILGDHDKFDTKTKTDNFHTDNNNGYVNREQDQNRPSCLYSVAGKGPYISRPMGHIDRKPFLDNKEEYHNMEITYYDIIDFSEELGSTVRDSGAREAPHGQDGMILTDNSATSRILGLNDYLIPTRVAITQISADTNGGIYEAYCKFITPEILEQVRTSGIDTGERISYLNKAISLIIREYISMVMSATQYAGFDEAVEGIGERNEKLRLVDDQARANILNGGYPSDELVALLKEKYVLVMDEVENLPVFEFANAAGDSSSIDATWLQKKFNFISISKIYSKMLEIYANESSSLFSYNDGAQDEIFDDPGYLLKNTKYIRSANAKNQYIGNFLNIPQTNSVEAEIGEIVAGTVAVVARTRERAEKRFRDCYKDYIQSVHWLYQHNLHNIYNQESGRASMADTKPHIKNRIRLSFANLMIWQKQERFESLWGKTTNSTPFMRAWVDPNSNIVREERPDPIKFVSGPEVLDTSNLAGWDWLAGSSYRLRVEIPVTRIEELHSYKCGFSPFRSDGRMNFLEARGYIYNNIDLWIKSYYGHTSLFINAESPISTLERLSKEDILESQDQVFLEYESFNSETGEYESQSTSFSAGDEEGYQPPAPVPSILAPFYPTYWFWRSTGNQQWKHLYTIGSRPGDYILRVPSSAGGANDFSTDRERIRRAKTKISDIRASKLIDRLEATYEGQGIGDRLCGLYRRQSLGYQVMVHSAVDRLRIQAFKNLHRLKTRYATQASNFGGAVDHYGDDSSTNPGRYPDEYSSPSLTGLSPLAAGSPAGHNYLMAVSGREGWNEKDINDTLAGRYASFNVFNEDFEYLAKYSNAEDTGNPLVLLRAAFSRMNTTQKEEDYTADAAGLTFGISSVGEARIAYNSLTDFYRKELSWSQAEGQASHLFDSVDSKMYKDIKYINEHLRTPIQGENFVSDLGKATSGDHAHAYPEGAHLFNYTSTGQSMTLPVGKHNMGFKDNISKQVFYTGPNRGLVFLKHSLSIKENVRTLAGHWDGFLGGTTPGMPWSPVSSISAIAQLARTSFWEATTGKLKEIMRDSKIYQGIRLVHATPADDLNSTNLASIWTKEEFLTISKEERSFVMRSLPTAPNLSEEIDISEMTAEDLRVFCVPLASWEQEIDWTQSDSSCWSMANFKRIFNENELFRIRMIQEAESKEDYETMVNYVFPIKTLMASVTAFGTATLGGFSTMPKLFSSTKSSLAYVFYVADTINNNAKSSAMDITSSELFKQVMKASSDDGPLLDCFDFPFPEDFFKQFLEALKNLILYLPSYIFRGIADKLDPMYKEMKVHWFACDMKEFSWFGVDVDSTNWPIPGKPFARSLKTGLKEDRLETSKNKDGQYVPVNLGFPLDLIQTTPPLLIGQYEGFLGTMDKFLAYIYSGNLPWLDLSFAFEIPCIDVDLSKEYDRFDIGAHGRYGHPLTPLTALALSTFVLPGEEELRKKICEIEEPPEECSDE